MYSNIMVALDDTDASRRVIDEVIQIGKGTDASMRIVFVADARALASYPSACRKDVFQRARTMLDAAQARLRAAGIECDTALEETRGSADTVAACLLRCAARMSADVVVMGTHGRSGLRRLALGSVAEAFVRRSACPVLLARAPVNA